MKISNKFNKIPPLLYDEIDELKNSILSKGKEVIDFGVGDPELSPPEWIFDELTKAFKFKGYNRYPSTRGDLLLRKKVSEYYKKRFNVTIDPEKEVIILIGAKEGISHLALACCDPGDVVLVPDPAYPVYKSSSLIAGAVPYEMPLLEKNNYFPNFSDIPLSIRRLAKLMHLNYPNNPTSACANIDLFNETAEFAEKNNIIVSHDMAYSEIMLDNSDPVSFMQAKNAKDIGIEFGSWSKSYNVTGWRIAYAVGNEKIIDALFKIKTNVDSGVCRSIQYAAGILLEKGDDFIKEMRNIYRKRREIFVNALEKKGFKVYRTNATFYVWAKPPVKNVRSFDYVKTLLEKTGILCSPGKGFGDTGEGYLRFSLSLSEEQILKAIKKLEKL